MFFEQRPRLAARMRHVRPDRFAQLIGRFRQMAALGTRAARRKGPLRRRIRSAVRLRDPLARGRLGLLDAGKALVRLPAASLLDLPAHAVFGLA
jgi:hypothetical protein